MNKSTEEPQGALIFTATVNLSLLFQEAEGLQLRIHRSPLSVKVHPVLQSATRSIRSFTRIEMATTVSESVAMQCGNFASHSTLRMQAGRVVATDPRRRLLLNTNSIYLALRVAILPSHPSNLALKLHRLPKARKHSPESARCDSTYVIQSKIKRRVTTAK